MKAIVRSWGLLVVPMSALGEIKIVEEQTFDGETMFTPKKDRLDVRLVDDDQVLEKCEAEQKIELSSRAKLAEVEKELKDLKNKEKREKLFVKCINHPDYTEITGEQVRAFIAQLGEYYLDNVPDIEDVQKWIRKNG